MGRLDGIWRFISEVERLALESQEKIEVPINHYFSNGVYAREMKLTAGALIVGKIHRFENLNILSEGEASVFSIDGVMRIKAPHTFVGSKGAKRIIYAHTNLTWTTIHATQETDVDKIETEVIAPSYEDIYLASDRTLDDVILALGSSREALKQISENVDDVIYYKTIGIEIGESPIHGLGVFLNTKVGSGEYIGLARVGGKRTEIGRYCNHSGQPNAYMEQNSRGDVLVRALYELDGRIEKVEVLTDYFYNFVNSRGG